MNNQTFWGLSFYAQRLNYDLCYSKPTDTKSLLLIEKFLAEDSKVGEFLICAPE